MMIIAVNYFGLLVTHGLVLKILQVVKMSLSGHLLHHVCQSGGFKQMISPFVLLFCMFLFSVTENMYKVSCFNIRVLNELINT